MSIKINNSYRRNVVVFSFMVETKNNERKIEQGREVVIMLELRDVQADSSRGRWEAQEAKLSGRMRNIENITVTAE